MLGRSMMEMLGVLAVIGVLSIGALAAFKLAMTYHKANETIHDVMLRATNVPMIDEEYKNRTTGYEWEFAGLPLNGRRGNFYMMNTVPSDMAAYIYKVEVVNVPASVCRKILQMKPMDIDLIKVGNTPFTGKNEDICGSEGEVSALWIRSAYAANGLVKMSFYFDDDWTNTGGSSGGGSDSPKPCIGSDCGVTGCTGSDCCIGADCNTDGTCAGADCCNGVGCQTEGNNPKSCPPVFCTNCQTSGFDDKGCPMCVTSSDCCTDRGGVVQTYFTGECCSANHTCCSVDGSCPADLTCTPSATCCGQTPECGTCQTLITLDGCPTCVVDEGCCMTQGGKVCYNSFGTCCDHATSYCYTGNTCPESDCQIEQENAASCGGGGGAKCTSATNINAFCAGKFPNSATKCWTCLMGQCVPEKLGYEDGCGCTQGQTRYFDNPWYKCCDYAACGQAGESIPSFCCGAGQVCVPAGLDNTVKICCDQAQACGSNACCIAGSVCADTTGKCCPNTTPVWNNANEQCVECTSNQHCAARTDGKTSCFDGKCVLADALFCERVVNSCNSWCSKMNNGECENQSCYFGRAEIYHTNCPNGSNFAYRCYINYWCPNDGSWKVYYQALCG